MSDRRKYKRSPIELTAQYLEGDDGLWKECSVNNISREGMGLWVYSRESISIGATLQLKIAIPVRQGLVKASGSVMWIKSLTHDPRFSFVGGVRLTAIDPGDKWRLLDYVYEAWRKTGNEEV